jgi:signal transduction histidine kinase
MTDGVARLRVWEHEHPFAADAFLAAVLAAFALLELTAGRDEVEGPWWGQALCFLVLTGSVALRRRAVIAATTLAGAALVVQELLGTAPVVSGFLAMLIVLYSAGAHAPRRTSLAALAVMLVALSVHPLTHEESRTADDLIGNLVIVWGVWALGRAVRHHRGRERELATAQAELRSRHDADQRAALAAERARIARDLHDVVAHGVSVMVLQAGAARSVLDTDPERARDPLLAIESSGRQALEDLQRMLGVLRDPATDNGREPPAGLADLPRLMERMQHAGLDVRLQVHGQPGRLPEHIEHCAYRVVQEALTNVIKHAAGATTHVRVSVGTDGVRVDVEDTGGTVERPAARLPDSGHGLIGLHERVGLYGGTLTAGPTSGGGWLLAAELPVRSAALVDGAVDA